MTFSVITPADFDLYQRFDGDVDGLSRSNDPVADVSEGQWHVIDTLRQRLFIAASGRGSRGFGEKLDADLAAHMPDEHVRAELRRLVASDLEVKLK